MSGVWGDRMTFEGRPERSRPHAALSLPIDVLVVDDDYYAREAMRMLLSRDRRTRVWGLADGVAGTEALLRNISATSRPAVVLQDVRMTEGEHAGIRNAARIREMCPTAKILMTSIERDEETILEAIRAGADGYVWKNESTDGIASAVVEIASDRFVVTRSIAERILGKTGDLVAYATEILPDSDPHRDLTHAMRETVHLFCTCGLSAKEIADELRVSPNTVYSRIKTAYAILDATSREDAFQRFVERVGAASH